jgi:hypothetical protein
MVCAWRGLAEHEMSNQRQYEIHAFVEHQIGLIPALSLEQRSDLQAYVALLCNERKAKTVFQQMSIFSYVLSKQHELRLNNQRAALAQAALVRTAEMYFTKLDYPEANLTPEMKASVSVMARKYAEDDKFRAETGERLIVAGFQPDAIEREAERQVLTTVEPAAERLALSFARRNQVALKALRDVEALEKHLNH